MAINAYITDPAAITASIPTLTPEEAGVKDYVYIKGDPGPQGPPGPEGPDGTTFTPSVNADGDISWTNDGGKTNPPTVNIKGPQGEEGPTGPSGATFTPSVDADGDISWTNDKGLPNPATQNIKGPQGDPGSTGPQGPAGGMYYAVCNTAAATAQKEITVAEITTLSAGLSVNVKFAHANSATAPTLKVNTLDAKPIYQYGTTAAGATAATTGWQDGAVVQLTYDGTGWVRDQGYNTNTTYNISHVQCATSASTAAKTASCSYYALRTGNTFIIVFRYSNTKAAALTLAINSTTAKPIYINGAASSSTNYTLPAGTYLCYYDGTAYQIRTDGASPVPNSIPDGGTTGQILKKNSSTDYDVSWANESGSVTSVDGKTGAVTVLPVGGASGKVLKKSSATDYDVEWGDADARNIWYATCSTATGTAAKVATSSSGNFTLATGAMVRVKFTNTNNQPNATLSVDGSTAKAIKNLPSDSNVNTQWWRAGEVIDLVYDGTDFIMSDGGMASASYYGKTILSNSTSSSSQTTAATSKAVKDAKEEALAHSIAVQDSAPTNGELVWVDTDEPGASHELLEMSDFVSGTGYCKMPDGTMMCWGQKTSSANSSTQWGTGYAANFDPITFPQTFIAAPSATITVSGTASFAIVSASVGTTGISNIQAFRPGTFPSSTFAYNWIAIGRWKA